MGKMENKVAVITGGNSGVGKAAALLLAGEGAKVVLTARRRGLLEEVAEEIRRQGGDAVAVPADVGKSEDAKRVLDACIQHYGRVDVLVNCHGVQSKIITFLDRCEDDTWEYVMNANARGAFNTMREALRHMAPAGAGNIINIASVAGVNGGGDAVYVASKGAIIAMTKHVGLAYAARHIRCNAICPGSILTPMTEPNLRGESLDFELLAEMDKHGDKKLGASKAEDVANTILFLACEDSRNINGQALVTDFGYAL